MFSNRSVSVQPSAPPIEYALVPEARSVFAAATSCGHVFGAVTPAFLNDATLYQTVDLLAPFQMRPYSLPLTVPSVDHTGAKFALIVGNANVIGFSAPLLTKSLTRPGCPSMATSG